MAVEWTDPASILAVAGTEARAADFNTALDNLQFVYDPPRCALRITSDQEVANATDHTIEWDEAVWDSHGDMWDVGGPSVVTITRDGVYSFQLSNLWEESAAGGKRAAFLQVNGTRRADFYQASADGVSPFASSNTIETNLEDGDSIDIDVRQLSGAPLDLIANRTRLIVRWVAAPPASGE